MTTRPLSLDLAPAAVVSAAAARFRRVARGLSDRDLAACSAALRRGRALPLDAATAARIEWLEFSAARRIVDEELARRSRQSGAA